MNKVKSKQRGIFCIEGEWESDLKYHFSVEPVLEMLTKWGPTIPYIRRDAGTREELVYYLKKWTQRRYATHPILYLAFHGGENEIYLGDWRKRDAVVTLDQLGELLEGKCDGRIVYFGSCETVSIDGRRLSSFLRKTQALAVCGYTKWVNSLRAAAFELLVFDAMQSKSLTLQGARAMNSLIQSESRQLSKELGFRMWVRRPRN